MSGHSKWANIQHRKGRQDAKRSNLWTKLVREIIVAARVGGSGDPDMNSRNWVYYAQHTNRARTDYFGHRIVHNPAKRIPNIS